MQASKEVLTLGLFYFNELNFAGCSSHSANAWLIPRRTAFTYSLATFRWSMTDVAIVGNVLVVPDC